VNLKPPQIVKELDRYIIGQDKAKKAVAVALRNRYRRKKLEPSLVQEVIPKNILMIGPTGVGKTEIARRLAKLSNAPFIKIEATKFTEVGYVGRDVDSMIRDLMDIAINMFKKLAQESKKKAALEIAIKRVLDAFLPKDSSDSDRKNFKQQIKDGELDLRMVEIAVQDSGKKIQNNVYSGQGTMTNGMLNLGDMFNRTFGNLKTKMKKIKIKEALKILVAEESEKLIDEDKIISSALNAVENDAIVFIDEIDKIASSGPASRNQGVSREGVQRDLLPLIEGTAVSTKYGPVNTDHILFIASGSFYTSKPSDLLPELQGRLPIRVEMKHLSTEDMVRILTEPENNIIRQYKALMATDGCSIDFTDDAIKKIAEFATTLNNEIENIGARRLHTIAEKLLDDISFDAGSIDETQFTIDVNFVNNKLKELMKKTDLTRFIL
jgi:ATP-dependent HslUV protease ATP-binding subunit HslU